MHALKIRQAISDGLMRELGGEMPALAFEALVDELTAAVIDTDSDE